MADGSRRVVGVFVEGGGQEVVLVAVTWGLGCVWLGRNKPLHKQQMVSTIKLIKAKELINLTLKTFLFGFLWTLMVDRLKRKKNVYNEALIPIWCGVKAAWCPIFDVRDSNNGNKNKMVRNELKWKRLNKNKEATTQLTQNRLGEGRNKHNKETRKTTQ